MQLGNFIGVFLTRHVSSICTHHQEHYMLGCSIWFYEPSFWMGGGLESRCLGGVHGADGAVRWHHPHRAHIWCSWWWAYVPETCRATNTPIKLPSCIKLEFHFISWRRCTVKQTSNYIFFFLRKPQFFYKNRNKLRNALCWYTEVSYI